MKGQYRRAMLAAAVLATAIAVAWAAGQEDAAESYAAPARPEQPSAAPGNSLPAAPAFPDIAAVRARTAGFSTRGQDAFAPASWKPRVAEKPAAPTAPPLPYSYFGRMTEDGKLFVFLQRGERSYMAARGDVLDNEYRVEQIAPNAVVLTYLPLKQRQVLDTGS